MRVRLPSLQAFHEILILNMIHNYCVASIRYDKHYICTYVQCNYSVYIRHTFYRPNLTLSTHTYNLLKQDNNLQMHTPYIPTDKAISVMSLREEWKASFT